MLRENVHNLLRSKGRRNKISLKKNMKESLMIIYFKIRQKRKKRKGRETYFAKCLVDMYRIIDDLLTLHNYAI